MLIWWWFDENIDDQSSCRWNNWLGEAHMLQVRIFGRNMDWASFSMPMKGRQAAIVHATFPLASFLRSTPSPLCAPLALPSSRAPSALTAPASYFWKGNFSDRIPGTPLRNRKQEREKTNWCGAVNSRRKSPSLLSPLSSDLMATWLKFQSHFSRTHSRMINRHYRDFLIRGSNQVRLRWRQIETMISLMNWELYLKICTWSKS